MFNDLREFISKAEEIGEVKLVEGADWDLEISALTELMVTEPNPPLLLFDKVKGYQAGYRVATNLFASPRRTALG
ncbi:UbiD family decarboxylase, partial [Chloroflexota bacterium]